MILAHELTHVLQDQHFDLNKLRTDAAAGADLAVLSLIEGDAVSIENEYYNAGSRPPSRPRTMRPRRRTTASSKPGDPPMSHRYCRSSSMRPTSSALRSSPHFAMTAATGASTPGLPTRLRRWSK